MLMALKNSRRFKTVLSADFIASLLHCYRCFREDTLKLSLQSLSKANAIPMQSKAQDCKTMTQFEIAPFRWELNKRIYLSFECMIFVSCAHNGDSLLVSGSRNCLKCAEFTL